MKSGSLTIVGTGILAAGQLTIEGKSYIQAADKLLYLVADPITHRYLEQLNPTGEDLYKYYVAGKPRLETYMEMVEKILAEVRKGQQVCVAFYGHPGVFVYPSHESIRQAREEGFPAKMLPAPSSEDCLFADLGLDPALGCQSFEATSFLVRKVRFDPSCILLLWQVGVIGDLKYTPSPVDPSKGLTILTEYLLRFYQPDHIVIVYEASHYPVCEPRMDAVYLKDLPRVEVTGISTLCVPPIEPGALDEEEVKRLGIDPEHIAKAVITLQLPPARSLS